MRGEVLGIIMAMAILLGGAWRASAEIYIWTDGGGIVHMTDQWSNVPEPMRPRVSVRQSSSVARDASPAPQPAREQMPRVEPQTVKPSPSQMLPDLAEMPPSAAPSPSIMPYPRDTSILIPDSRPFVRRPKKLSPPFPYNVRLDPSDRNFVWVGPSRVPKDTFTYPRVSLETQAKFRNRLRTLEQRRATSPPGVTRSRLMRP